MRKYFTRNDIILITAILTVSLVFTAILYSGGEKGNTVSVYVDGEKKWECQLDQDISIDINGFAGGHNTLIVQNGYAWMSDASCPDRLCIHQGRISDEGQMIVCMPNRVIVKVEKTVDGEVGVYDAITQ